jgi:glycine cleavage system transcriptional repressor
MNWQMLTLVGEDQPGIVAQVTDALYRGGCTLGETSMIRLGGNFSIMMMVNGGHAERNLTSLIAPVAEQLQLKFHIDPIHGGLHRHRVPNFQVRVNGADRAGIVAKVTGTLAKCGFNILELESDVVGDSEKPVYIMTMRRRKSKSSKRHCNRSHWRISMFISLLLRH